MSLSPREEQDERFKQLALKAQQHESQTRERRRALTRLVEGIVSSGRLVRPSRNRLPPHFQRAYDDIYAEACQYLMLYVCQNIQAYAPDRGTVMAWVNMLMDRRFFSKAIGKFRDPREQRQMGRPDGETDPVDNLATPEDSDAQVYQALRQLITDDPGDRFKKKHIQKRPEVSFQVLMMRRLDGQQWQEISAALNLPIPTLSSFYQRSLKTFTPIFQDYLSP